VDSLLDIAANKLITMTQRAEVKDFVDLYFLLDRYSFWDLRDGVKAKFTIEVEPYSMAGIFMTAEDFEYLPKMIKPLTLDQLKTFYREKASDLGKRYIKK